MSTLSLAAYHRLGDYVEAPILVDREGGHFRRVNRPEKNRPLRGH
jgi:hypothetical protein